MVGLSLEINKCTTTPQNIIGVLRFAQLVWVGEYVTHCITVRIYGPCMKPLPQGPLWTFCVCDERNCLTLLLPMPHRLRLRCLHFTGANYFPTDASPQIQGQWRVHAGDVFRCCCSDDHQQRGCGVAQGVS